MRSSMQSILPKVAESQPAPRKSFKKFRSLNGAVNWIAKHPDNKGKLHHSDYTLYSGNKSDKWYIVNFQYKVRCEDE